MTTKFKIEVEILIGTGLERYDLFERKVVLGMSYWRFVGYSSDIVKITDKMHQIIKDRKSAPLCSEPMYFDENGNRVFL